MDDVVHEAYDEPDDAYETFEQQTLFLRLLQCIPRDARLDQASATALEDWILDFQRRRAVIGLLLRGMARLEIEAGAPTVKAHPGTPLPSLAELASRGELPPDWMNSGRPLPDA